jgi:hypothetical protein
MPRCFTTVDPLRFSYLSRGLKQKLCQACLVARGARVGWLLSGDTGGLIGAAYAAIATLESGCILGPMAAHSSHGLPDLTGILGAFCAIRAICFPSRHVH